MKGLLPRVLLPLTLMAPLLAQGAQWVKVGSADGSTSYLDKASVKRSGGEVRAASLVSFGATQSTPDGTRYRSMTAQHLYSCEHRTTTLLAQSYYPEPMGKGPVGQSFKYEKFAPEPVAAGSAAEGALGIICRHKSKAGPAGRG